MKVLGIIPARGGSKGVPGKNIKPLAGKPLIAYTAEAALKVKGITKVLLSTDDPVTAQIGKDLGLYVPFLRPAELALDSTPTLPVIQHAIEYLLAQGEAYDAVCLLQCTNPLRDPLDIQSALDKFFLGNYDSLISTLEVPLEHNPYWTFLEDENGYLKLATGGTEPISRRQLLPKAFFREGSIYITKTSVISEQNSLYGKHIGGYLLKSEIQINIDSAEDWQKAEKYFNKI